MKIRILGNSLRFRLTVSEVEALCKTGFVEDITVFPEGTFTYAVKMVPEARKLHAGFDGHHMVLSLPEVLGEGWADNAIVGFDNVQELPGGGNLKLLLEKDFACLEKRDEDDRDTYPNPKTGTN